MVDLCGGILQALSLAQAKRCKPGGRNVLGSVARRKIAELVEKRQHFVQIAIADGIFVEVGTGLLHVVGNRNLGPVDQILVARIAHPPERSRGDGDEGYRQIKTGLENTSPAHGGAVERHPAGFADDNLQDEIGEEKTLAEAGIGLWTN